MATKRQHGEVHPGWKWGIFTFRVPFYHTRVEWSEFMQGLFVAGATSMALVPLLISQFGLSFEEAIACAMLQSFLISTGPILFGDPYASGWVTPALPLTLTFVLTAYETPVERFQMMTALSLDLALIFFIFGITGFGKRLMNWLPNVLKAGIIMGAAIASFKRVFIDDADNYLWQQPVATIVASAVCLIFAFSIPLQKLRKRYKFIDLLASLGLLPGFIIAAIIGPLLGEIVYNIEWGILIPPFMDLWEKVSPFSIGFPSGAYFIAALPLAFITYIIVFGDIITGTEIIKGASDERPDEKIDFNINRTHHSLSIRNILMGLFAPFFPTQGILWTGVHVIVVQRWKEGREKVDSLFSGISSYYIFGIPFLFMLLPVATGLRPLMGIALSLTLILTGFACAYVASALIKTPAERGTALLIGMVLAIFDPWVGILVGLLATILLVGIEKEVPPSEKTD